MHAGIFMLVISSLAGAIAWVVAGASLSGWLVGIATFLFLLLGGFFYATEIDAGNSSAGADKGAGDGAPGQFGGRAVSGSWK